MTFEPFQKVLDKAANRYGISREFRAIKVCRTFESLIPDVFVSKEDLGKIMNRNSFKDGVLTICVPGSTWASEIMIKKETILGLMNERLKDDPTRVFVKDLRTRII